MSAVILRRIMRFIRSLLLAALAVCMLSAGTPAHARSSFWPQFRFWGGDHHFRHKHQHKQTKSDLTKKPQSQDAPKGPLQIIISIADQRISLYENGALIARSSVSTGVERHPTPLGVFSVLSKKKWHRSNIYSAAPMPYMQRITWSGIALHAGDLPGYPASHGCIRLTNDFAIRLWHLTKWGTRVIIAHEDVRPVEITNPQLFVPKPRVASASPESSTATLASNDSVTGATTHAPLMSKTDEGTKTSDPASAGVRAQKVVPISVFVSRQLSKLFVRRGFKPLFDVPIKIRDIAEPMGTHVFSAMEFQNEGAAIRWTVVSIPERSSTNQGTPPRLHKGSSIPDKANAALERIEIPQDVVDRISELLTPGSSLIVSDYGISHETGRDTDFIVLTH
jgi:L,D-transpeptidase catalytic domain